MSKAIALLFKVFLTGFEEWRTTPQIDKHNSQIKKINKNKGWLFRSFHLVYNTVFVHVNSLQIWRDHTKENIAAEQSLQSSPNVGGGSWSGFMPNEQNYIDFLYIISLWLNTQWVNNYTDT